MNVYTITEQIKDNTSAFGYHAAAKMYVKKMPFTLYYFLLFGRLPTTRLTHDKKVIHCV